MINPVAFEIGPFSIRWYALCIVAGLVLAVYLAMKEAPKKKILSDDILDFILIALGLLFFSTIHLLTRSHYVFKDRTLPVISSFTAIGINILLDWLLYKQYRHVGLTFATSFSAMVNFLILYISLTTRYVRLRNFKYIVILGITFVISGISFYLSKLVKLNLLGRFNIAINLAVFAAIYFIIWFILISIFRKDIIERILRKTIKKGRNR